MAHVQKRIFAVVLLDAPPPELAREVEHRREELVEPEALCLRPDRLCGGLEQGRIERGCQTDGGWPDGTVVCEPVQACSGLFVSLRLRQYAMVMACLRT